MYQLYNLVLLIVAVILLPYYLLRGIRYGKSRRGVRERLGYYDPQLLAALPGRPVVWIHAVSVGESRAAVPLIRHLRKHCPEYRILLSNVTETGHAIARENPDIDDCIFFPFDFSWTVKRSLSLIRPHAVIIVETEIWPNFSRRAREMDIPLFLVNGRISDRSYPRYRRGRFFLKPILGCFTAFCMQSQADSERIIALGAERQRVENTGNLKFDHELREMSAGETCQRKKDYKIAPDCMVMVAGSTHEGEEKQLLEVYKNLHARIECNLLLILIPRHPERVREIRGLLDKTGMSYRIRSALDASQELFDAGDVLLVDTLGEVLDFYSVADLVFVGGSLVPVGGHNLLEAALLAKPVLFGPHVHNFKEISAKLIRAGAGLMVRNPRELEQQSALMLNDPARCRAMGEAGRNLIAENAGATVRTMRHIAKVLH